MFHAAVDEYRITVPRVLITVRLMYERALMKFVR
jgi:hypothetical protein